VHGFLGASLLKTEAKGGIEYLVLTRWSSMAAIEGFAGSDIGKAVVEPEAIAALTDYDRTAVHYEVVEDVG
jgi:heme-degrading monooxygenase HmoA